MNDGNPPHFNRDISWLAFNERVLQEAADPSVPLYERIKFLAIYSSNLDEFFRVRVAALRSFRKLKKETRREMEIRPKKELRRIRSIVSAQQETFGRIFREEILPALAEGGVFLLNEMEYNEEQQAFARQFFFKKIYPHLPPFQTLEEDQPAPFLENKALYFIVQLKENPALTLVEIPTAFAPRFIPLPSPEGLHHITFLDDLLRFNLPGILGEPVEGAFAIKISRDAEMYIEDEYSGDLLTKIKKGLEERQKGLPTRFLYDSQMPGELLQRLKRLFHLSKNDLIPGARYHNFNDFFTFPLPEGREEWQDPLLPPMAHPQLEGAAQLLEAIEEKDFALHFPYQSFHYLPRLIREAAEDDAVQAIKITLYRVASPSDIGEALLFALKKGKKVTAFIEAKARFDEETNIVMGEKLQQAGGHVYYSHPGIKVHAKLLLIIRQPEVEKRFVAYLSTGNFNEKTARLYTDHGLLTADQRITREVDQVFAVLEHRLPVPDCRHLLVAPFSLRDQFMAMIDREIELARKGKEAYMILKMNSLEEDRMIDKLYEASRAGVRIRLIIRGICCLQPGIEGLSENITAVSIIDRFLEHARVFIFGNDGQEKMYLSSADWMVRNLYRRIEVATPVYDPGIYREIRRIIALQLEDNAKARIIDAEQNNPRRQPLPGETPQRAQTAIYAYLRP